MDAAADGETNPKPGPPLTTLVVFPEKTAANVDEKIKKDLKNTHHLVVLEGTVDVLEQNPLTVKLLQAWLPTLKPVFAELIDGTMKKSVMERSYFAYLVTRFRLCGQSRNDPIATAMIQLTAQASIYCRENALGALYSAEVLITLSKRIASWDRP